MSALLLLGRCGVAGKRGGAHLLLPTQACRCGHLGPPPAGAAARPGGAQPGTSQPPASGSPAPTAPPCLAALPPRCGHQTPVHLPITTHTGCGAWRQCGLARGHAAPAAQHGPRGALGPPAPTHPVPPPARHWHPLPPRQGRDTAAAPPPRTCHSGQPALAVPAGPQGRCGGLVGHRPMLLQLGGNFQQKLLLQQGPGGCAVQGGKESAGTVGARGAAWGAGTHPEAATHTACRSRRASLLWPPAAVGRGLPRTAARAAALEHARSALGERRMAAWQAAACTLSLLRCLFMAALLIAPRRSSTDRRHSGARRSSAACSLPAADSRAAAPSRCAAAAASPCCSRCWR